MSCKVLFNDFNLDICANASTCPGYRITETLLNFAPSGMCIDLSSPDSKFSFDHLEYDMCANKININPELYEFADKNMDHISQACQRGFNFMSRLCVCDYSHDCGLLFACPLKAHTQAFFNANDSYDFNNSEISNMFIVIDGGFFEGHIRHSTWAASIVLEDSHQVFKVAKSFGGQLPFDPSNPMFCGEVLPSNSFVSEVYAQVMARLILIRYFKDFNICPNTPVTIVYDNMSSSFVTTCSKASKTQPVLVFFANILDHFCTTVFNLRYSHVHSHDCHPLNDYVDSICTHMRESSLTPCFF